MDFVRKRKINLPLGVLGAVILASFVYIYVYVYVVLMRMSTNYVSYIIGFLGVMFFATIPIVIIYKYMLRVLPEQKVLSIDESGIKIHIGDGCEFSWHEIKTINKITIGSNKCLALTINLNNGGRKSVDKKRKGNILYFPKEYGGHGDISIIFQGISPDLDDAITEVHKYYSGAIKEVVH
jgi:hypothetical protein